MRTLLEQPARGCDDLIGGIYTRLFRCRSCEHAQYSATWEYKTLADSDVVRNFHVHWGAVKPGLLPPGEPARAGVPPSACASVAHLPFLLESAADRLGSADYRISNALLKLVAMATNSSGAGSLHGFHIQKLRRRRLREPTGPWHGGTAGAPYACHP